MKIMSSHYANTLREADVTGLAFRKGSVRNVFAGDSLGCRTAVPSQAPSPPAPPSPPQQGEEVRAGSPASV